MGADKETREKLIESAKAEFLEKGYMKASLRSICAKAGVTTGALYFFFDNKEDLFAEVVDKPLNELFTLLKEHFEADNEAVAQLEVTDRMENDEDHMALAYGIVHLLYSNYDAFLLLITKAQGSRYEHIMDSMADSIEKNYRSTVAIAIRKFPFIKTNEYMLRWLTHMSVDAFLYLFIHERDEAQAKKHVKRIMNSILRNWYELLLTPDE